MFNWVENLGKIIIYGTRSLKETFTFAFLIVAGLFRSQTYNSASYIVLLHQIYFTAIQVLPLFLTMAAVIGFLLTGIFLHNLKELGLAAHFGRVIMGFVVTELSPFLTVLLIALRSSSAINAEIATMKVNKELNTLETFNIDLISYLFVPRVVAGMVSVLLLSGLFAIVLLISGFLSSRLLFGMSLNEYGNTLLNSAKLTDIFILLIKCFIFGFFIILIPIYSGINATYELTSIPVAVLRGMVRIFIAIIVIEVLSLIARFA